MAWRIAARGTVHPLRAFCACQGFATDRHRFPVPLENCSFAGTGQEGSNLSVLVYSKGIRLRIFERGAEEIVNVLILGFRYYSSQALWAG